MRPFRLPLFLGALALGIAAALPASADKLSLAQISSYLNSLQTVESEFTQINDDGTISTGTIWIKRPGRIRFEYDPPEEALVLAGGGQLAVFDPKVGPEPDRYPLNQTPLKIILDRNVDLTRANMVTGHSYDGVSTTVRAQDPDNPDYGSIDLVFTGDPIQLRQWVVNDSSGGSTTVVLGDTRVGGTVRDNLFNIIAETNRRLD